ncbi:DUF6602 domain-containing protein [Paenibacillus sp. Soil787]|uniref:DUF6602 domain-containing protein n=1 Tax=Paenibacillus sp. Soil787 TaxID=1736411 RepID=UPI0006FFE551|nr:DUF6602 domain-containing protein [Paenibacillus sp. Soil787]KRF39821.1 hypothetical protein ASG93_22930 [Paenibacillus sp. Soil787]
MRINPIKYQETVTLELKAIQDRVRYLIADGNWAEEGRYKEEILKGVIAKRLPGNLSIGSGFIVREANNGDIERSKQVDLIIYDNTIPLLFKEGDFIITTPSNVKAIIEVKTRLASDKETLDKIFKSATDNGKMLAPCRFNGIFSYNSGSLITDQNIKEYLVTALKCSKGVINHLCIGENYFVKYWSNGNPTNRGYDNRPCYSIYEINQLSFSYFISNLIESLSLEIEMFDRQWFLFPIEGGKESKKIADVFVDN